MDIVSHHDILLVSANLCGFRGRRSRYHSPNQGVLRLAATLEQHGYRVECRDYQTADADDLMDAEHLAAFLETDATVLGIGCTSDTLPLVVAATRRFKERHPSTKLILGGHGPSEVAEALLKCFPHLDAVVRGEGEETLLDVMNCDGRLDHVPGISYRDGDLVKANPPRPRLIELDQLPGPAYQHVDWERYEGADVETARGCPYACAFCSASPFFQRRYVARSLDGVMAELSLLSRSYGVRRVSFSDDTFVIDRRRVLDLCERLRAAGLGIAWECYGRVNLMDEGLMAAMAGAGCRRVFYGIESGSNAVLNQLRKGTTIEQAEEVVRLSTRYFAKVALGFIWGLPFESLADFEATLRAIGRFVGFGPQIEIELSLWTPFPSSALYEQWGSRKVFSPSFVPMIGNLLTDGEESMARREIAALVGDYPDVFAALYHVPEPALSHKRDALDGRAWLVEVLAALAAVNQEFAGRLRESPDAGLRQLRLPPSPAAVWAAAEAAVRLPPARQQLNPFWEGGRSKCLCKP